MPLRPIHLAPLALLSIFSPAQSIGHAAVQANQRQMMDMAGSRLLAQMQADQQRLMAKKAAQQARQQKEMRAPGSGLSLSTEPVAKPTGEAWAEGLDQKACTPLFDDHRLIAASALSNRMRRLDPKTGKTLWGYSLPQKLSGEPVLAAGSVAFATEHPGITILDADTGKERKTLALHPLDPYLFGARADHLRATTPAQAGSRLFVGTHGKGPEGPSGWIYAVDLAAPALAWEKPFPGGVDLTPLPLEGQLLVCGGGRVTSLRPEDGNSKWECKLGADDIVKDWLLLGTILTLISDRQVQAVDTTTGSLLWTLPFKGKPILVGEGNHLVCMEARGFLGRNEWLVAVDIRGGKKAWEVQVAQPGLPWIQHGKVFSMAGKALTAFNLLDGKALWTQTFPDAPMIPITVSGESIYVVLPTAKAALLKALKTSDGSSAWEADCPEPEGLGMVLPLDQGFLFPKSDRSLALLK